METLPHYNVLICTPGHSMEAEYVTSLVDTIKVLKDNNITYKYLNQYSSTVSGAREATLMGSLFLDAFNTKPLSGKVTYDKIFWIDSDISWEAKDFLTIYNSEKEVMSGVYINSQGVPMFKQLPNERDVNIHSMASSLKEFEVAAVGFGFVAIKSGIHENMKRPWFDSIFEEIENEDKTQKMNIPFGEDFSWCYRARDLGYRIFVNPSVKITHHKKMPLKPR